MVSIGLFGAFVAGILSILSPCSALLLPAFFAYAFTSKSQLTARTFAFLAGMTLVLIPLGVGVGWLGSALAVHRSTLITVGGLVMIILGLLVFAGVGFRVPGWSEASIRIRGSNWLAVFLLGMVYGFAGFCAGPLLGAVLTTALVSSSIVYGGLVMFMYALGMTVPLFVMALLWDRWDIGNQQWLRGQRVKLGPLTTNSISMISGIFFVIIGLLFVLSHGTASLPTALSIDKQSDIQNWFAERVGEMSDAAMLLGLGLVALVVLGWKIARHKE